MSHPQVQNLVPGCVPPLLLLNVDHPPEVLRWIRHRDELVEKWKKADMYDESKTWGFSATPEDKITMVLSLSHYAVCARVVWFLCIVWFSDVCVRSWRCVRGVGCVRTECDVCARSGMCVRGVGCVRAEWDVCVRSGMCVRCDVNSARR